MANNTRKLEGKVAIITGASRGIGAAAAKRFAAEGACVVLAARDEQALTALAKEIVADGGTALTAPTDVSDAGEVERLVQRTLETYGHLDAAFNNAGINTRMQPLVDTSLEDFNLTMNVNLVGTFLCMKYQIPAMLANGGGTIVNMASTAGLRGVRNLGPYVAAKHGIIGLSKTAALDYARQNIRVNVIAPGAILNDRIKAAGDQYIDQINNSVPIHRIGQPEEIAATAVWLCSDESSFVTGDVMLVDGGQLAGVA